MKRWGIRAWVIGLMALMALAANSPARAGDPGLEVGQVWTVRNAPNPELRALIARIEPFGKSDIVVHISLTGVLMQNPDGESVLTTASHLPFEQSVLVASLDTLVETGQPLDAHFATGYQIWLDDEGGIFTVPVAEVVSLLLNPVPPD
ncbi:hypothetical protein [Maricaulis sp.]|uniref:hypothetical protein n=1 Tax=Maricaulis sp. TaxID=1486257 RepID=UPI003A8E5EF1